MEVKKLPAVEQTKTSIVGWLITGVDMLSSLIALGDRRAAG